MRKSHHHPQLFKERSQIDALGLVVSEELVQLLRFFDVFLELLLQLFAQGQIILDVGFVFLEKVVLRLQGLEEVLEHVGELTVILEIGDDVVENVSGFVGPVHLECDEFFVCLGVILDELIHTLRDVLPSVFVLAEGPLESLGVERLGRNGEVSGSEGFLDVPLLVLLKESVILLSGSELLPNLVYFLLDFLVFARKVDVPALPALDEQHEKHLGKPLVFLAVIGVVDVQTELGTLGEVRDGGQSV